MKGTNKIVFGVLLIFCGVLFALHALDVFKLFDGWWTVFIIVPCAIGLFSGRNRLGNFIGVLCGAVLLLLCLDVLNYEIVKKLLVPVAVSLVGALIIVNAVRKNKSERPEGAPTAESADPKVCCAAFSGSDINFAGEKFQGADITAVFGGAKCDLRGAIFEGDATVKVLAIFGGVDILVPENVNVKVNSNSIFGGVDNKTAPKSDTPTVYVNAVCIFGGADIK